MARYNGWASKMDVGIATARDLWEGFIRYLHITVVFRGRIARKMQYVNDATCQKIN